MGSLSNSSFNSDDFDEDKTLTNKRHNTTIIPPHNDLTKATRIIQPNPSSWNITGKVRKRRLLVSSGSTPRDSLNTSSINEPKKRKSKNTVVIHNIDTHEANIPFESGLLTSVSDEVASFFDKVNDSPKKAKLDMYVQEKRERDKLKADDPDHNQTNDSNIDTITIHDSDSELDESKAKTIKTFLKSSKKDAKNRSYDVSLDEMINDKAKFKELKKKYSKIKSYVRPDIIESMDDIESLVDKYSEIIVNILNGVQASYFYTQAKKLQQSSKLLTIKDSEIANLPKETYYGYIGAVRGFHIGKVIESNKTISKLINEKIKYNKVIQFWGCFNFIQYVLVPEVIANVIMKYSKIHDLDKAYDEMEETNEYGLYVTNSYPLKMKEDFHEDSSNNNDHTEVVEILESQKASNIGSSEAPKDEDPSSTKYFSTRKLISNSDLEVSPPSSPDNLFG